VGQGMTRYAASGTHVYIIDAGDLCKIGTTSRVKKRVTQIANSYSDLIGKRNMRLAVAWEVFPHAALIEREVRASLNGRSLSLDWFYCDAATMRAAAEAALMRIGLDPPTVVRDFGELPNRQEPCTHPIYLAAIAREKKRKANRSISTVYRYFDATAVATLQEEGRLARRRKR